ncbi:unnamed protein product [Cylindrotheca closterium]|uniref:Uncharacterized protein n=1 Tax=Cylindrotheca closterium TaxID=2856 RepID=A0AAD2FS05_9STRA|nr:unnamed protein product [Cylindrotheca closterium]
MVPKFDPQTRKWSPTSPEEEASAGYDIWGSLLRQGPNPFIQRLFQADEYEQGVLKFMAGDKVDRNTAQAEMDAYLQNPNDWAYNRVNGYNVDYLTLNPKQIGLTLAWAAIIVPLLGRAIYCGITRDNVWAILP